MRAPTHEFKKQDDEEKNNRPWLINEGGDGRVMGGARYPPGTDVIDVRSRVVADMHISAAAAAVAHAARGPVSTRMAWPVVERVGVAGRTTRCCAGGGSGFLLHFKPALFVGHHNNNEDEHASTEKARRECVLGWHTPAALVAIAILVSLARRPPCCRLSGTGVGRWHTRCCGGGGGCARCGCW